MKTVRRLYFYAVALISVEVTLWGLIGLLRSIVSPDMIVNNAQTLAQALALVLVGTPIFLIHWLWAQRASAREEEEQTAIVRAIFLYAAMFGTLLPVAQNLLALINRAFLGAANISYGRALLGGTQSWADNLIAIAFNLLLAAYFWSVLRVEWASLPAVENFKDTRRLYRYLWTLYGLLMVVFGAQQVLRYVFYVPTEVIGTIGRETFVNGTALLMVGAPIWFFAWRGVQDALADSAEAASTLRLVILYLLALGGVLTVLTAGGNILFALLSRLFGEVVPTLDLIQKISGPLSLAIPFGAVWAYYGGWLSKQIASENNAARRAGMTRVYFYILSVIGLTTSVIGMILLFAFIVDQITDYANVIDQTVFAHRLAGALAVIAVGLPLWLMTWRPMQAEALADGEMGGHARRSIVRKAYLYLALFASVIGVMGSAGALIYELIQAALNGVAPSGFLNTILNAAQVLGVFATVLVYHLSALRKDGAAQTDALEDKLSEFSVAIFDHNGKFGEAVKDAFAKQAPKLPVTILNVVENVPADLKANVVVLSGSLAVNTPAVIEEWIRLFTGIKFVVEDKAAGVYWMGDYSQAVESARTLAEGQTIRPQSAAKTTPAWTYVVYVFAALFALQLTFMVLMLGVSMVSGF